MGLAIAAIHILQPSLIPALQEGQFQGRVAAWSIRPILFVVVATSIVPMKYAGPVSSRFVAKARMTVL